jgi:DNA-binding beta-propeller fold protein YncE
VANTGGTPNGIVYRALSDELLVAFWGGNAAVKTYDRATAELVGTLSTTLTNIDGIAIDCRDMVLLASWSPDRITRYEHGIPAPVFEDLMVPGLNNPADIDFDAVNNRICIPNSGANTVTLFDVDCSTGIPGLHTYTTKVLPNPTAGLVSFDPPLVGPEHYMVLDARGSLLAGGTLRRNAKLDISALPAGIYTILFTQSAQQMRVVKE